MIRHADLDYGRIDVQVSTSNISHFRIRASIVENTPWRRYKALLKRRTARRTGEGDVFVHVYGRSQAQRNNNNFWLCSNTPADSDAESFRNARGTVKVTSRTRLACVVERTRARRKTKTKPDYAMSIASVGFSRDVIFGRRRHHTTYRAPATTGDNALQHYISLNFIGSNTTWLYQSTDKLLVTCYDFEWHSTIKHKGTPRDLGRNGVPFFDAARIVQRTSDSSRTTSIF